MRSMKIHQIITNNLKLANRDIQAIDFNFIFTIRADGALDNEGGFAIL